MSGYVLGHLAGKEQRSDLFDTRAWTLSFATVSDNNKFPESSLLSQHPRKPMLRAPCLLQSAWETPNHPFSLTTHIIGGTQSTILSNSMILVKLLNIRDFRFPHLYYEKNNLNLVRFGVDIWYFAA